MVIYDNVTPDDRTGRLESHWLDWPETWVLRWKHYCAKTQHDYHQAQVAYHREAAGEALHIAQFWRNRQIARGKDVSYDYTDITCWLNWACGIVLGFATATVIGSLIVAYLTRG